MAQGRLHPAVLLRGAGAREAGHLGALSVRRLDERHAENREQKELGTSARPISRPLLPPVIVHDPALPAVVGGPYNRKGPRSVGAGTFREASAAHVMWNCERQGVNTVSRWSIG